MQAPVDGVEILSGCVAAGTEVTAKAAESGSHKARGC